MDRRRVIIAVVLAIAAAVAAWAIFFRASDEKQIRDAIAAAAEAVSVADDDHNPITRLAHVRRVFKQTVEQNAHLAVDDPHMAASGRDDLSMQAAGIANIFNQCTIDVSGLDIAIADDHASARVKATATLVGDRGGNRERESRAVTFLMRKSDGTWRVDSVTVWGRESGS